MEDFDDGWSGYEEPVFVHYWTPSLEGLPTGRHGSSLPSIRGKYLFL